MYQLIVQVTDIHGRTILSEPRLFQTFEQAQYEATSVNEALALKPGLMDFNVYVTHGPVAPHLILEDQAVMTLCLDDRAPYSRDLDEDIRIIQGCRKA